jgi:DNA mismatch repair ATPase MutS
LKFSFPTVSGAAKELRCAESFDIVLAYKLSCENRAVVTNDFFLEGPERVIVVTGPNQGGKTTFARTFGQMHYLARLGLPVPGSSARLFLCDGIFTHFEKEEDADSLRGKLQDDLVRLREILDRASGDSVIVLNEIFTSTALEDAIYLGGKIIRRIMELDALCVCVTFIDELAGLGEKAVSMMSTVMPETPALRTYKIVRKPPDGLAYALSIAEKYRLTHDQIVARIER